MTTTTVSYTHVDGLVVNIVQSDDNETMWSVAFNAPHPSDLQDIPEVDHQYIMLDDHLMLRVVNGIVTIETHNANNVFHVRDPYIFAEIKRDIELHIAAKSVIQPKLKITHQQAFHNCYKLTFTKSKYDRAHNPVNLYADHNLFTYYTRKIYVEPITTSDKSIRGSWGSTPSTIENSIIINPKEVTLKYRDSQPDVVYSLTLEDYNKLATVLKRC